MIDNIKNNNGMVEKETVDIGNKDDTNNVLHVVESNDHQISKVGYELMSSKFFFNCRQKYYFRINLKKLQQIYVACSLQYTHTECLT